tara:strand:- start:140 stop:1498 length:1359 start_codon:yes stop_codon:yes gene_type:complete
MSSISKDLNELFDKSQIKNQSLRGRAWENLRKNRTGILAGTTLVFFFLLALLGLINLSSNEPFFNSSQIRLPDKLKPPLSLPNSNILSSNEIPRFGIYLFGTDALGRDVFSRILEGTTISIAVGFVSVGISTILGILIGGLAGYYGETKIRGTSIITSILILCIGLFVWNNFGFVFFLIAIFGSILSFIYSKERNIFLGFCIATLLSIVSISPFDSFISSQTVNTTTIFLQKLVGIPLLVLLGILGIFYGKQLREKNFRKDSSFKKKIFSFLEKICLPKIDVIYTIIVDVQISFPTFFLILTVIALLPPSIWNIMIVIGLTSWVGVARFVRAEILSLREQPFVESAKAIGQSDKNIILLYLIPNSLAPVLVSATLGVAGAILTEAGLSFLGFGVPPPQASWGNILSDGKQYLFDAPWLTLIPGFSILILMLSFNLFGEALKDAFDPRKNKKI